MCRSKPDSAGDVRQVDEESDYISYLNAIDSPTLKRTPPIHVSMELDDRTVRMEVDTGAAYSLLSIATLSKSYGQTGS